MEGTKVKVSALLIGGVFRVYCINRQPEDWSLSWGGTNTIYGWGHNHRGQLGGVDGAKVKVPALCEALSALRPVQIVGGEQTLLAVTTEGKVYATGMIFY